MTFRHIYSLFIVLILLISTCSKESNTSTGSGDSGNEISGVEGDISGVWTAVNSPYQIIGDITILDGEMLTIEPGVEVIFTGHYKFNVLGRLMVVGTKQDSIKFTANNPNEGWHGIRLLNIEGTNDSSLFEYCIFEYGKANTGSGFNKSGGAIISNTEKLRISHSLFQYNIQSAASRPEGGGGAIAIIGGQPIIENCDFNANESTYGAAILNFGSSTNTIIRNNHFHNNSGHGTVNSVDGATPVLINNLIENNYSDGHGIVHIGGGSGKVVLINNTIVYNSCDRGDEGNYGGSGLFVNESTVPLCINNIIYGNESSSQVICPVSSNSFYNCLIEGCNDWSTDIYENCIDSNPLFVSSTDYHLQNNSPCIGAGIESVDVGGTVYNAPSFDIQGNQRPNPAGSNPDIGAYEN
jgi:hypothetical protein